jgi:hypothetical protein
LLSSRACSIRTAVASGGGAPSSADASADAAADATMEPETGRAWC